MAPKDRPVTRKTRTDPAESNAGGIVVAVEVDSLEEDEDEHVTVLAPLSETHITVVMVTVVVCLG